MTNSEKRIYIGPALSGRRLVPYTVYIGGLPEEARTIIRENPWFEKLFVPISDMNEKRAEIAREGTPLHLYYERAKEV